MNLVKVQYLNGETGEFGGREYTYFSEDRLKVGDIVAVPAKDGISKSRVSAIDVPESEIAHFRDKVKAIPAGSFANPTSEGVELEVDEELVGGPPDLSTMAVASENIKKDTWGTATLLPPPLTSGPEPYKKTQALVVAEKTAGDFSLEILKVREVTTEQEYEYYNKFLSKIAIALQDNEKKRAADVKAPNAYVKWLNFKYKEGSLLLTQAHSHCLKILGEFRRKKEEERKAEQAKVDAAAKRAFDKKQAEEAEARRKETEARAAAEEARKAGDYAAAEEARAAAEKAAAEALKKASPVPIFFGRKVEGLAGTIDTGGAKNIFGTEWDFEIVNPNLVPREYCLPDEKRIREFGKLYKEKAVMSGVRFFLKDKVSVRRAKPGEPEG